jgi:aminopeptidase N
MSIRSKATAAVASAAAMTHFAGTALAASPGAPGAGDPYYPKYGNGGYDVSHYDLKLGYDPTARHLAGTATITAIATQNLSRFDLDLTGLTVSAVTVDGAKATYARSGPELQITPAHGLPQRRAFTVAVTYAGRPKTVNGSPVVFGAAYGWIYTTDGAFVGDEPNGASTWFPSNDHPSDKATFSFKITVPSDRKVVANGDLVGQKAGGASTGNATTTFDWNETSPMATYLATIGIGRWTFALSRTPGGIPQFVAFDPSLAGQVAARKNAQLTGQVTDYWATKFGPYPFTSTGAIIDNVPGIGFSLETQTRPLYGFAPDPNTLSHELAHQWFGDSVSVQTWRDIWLNEGFATFAANLWTEHTGGPSTWAAAQQTFARTPASSAFWNQAIADPQRDTMFSQSVYVRGGLTLAALRHRIGDATFFTLLQKWTSAHRFGNATTAQFIALANQVSGQNLGHFFQIWLDATTRPASLSGG